MTNDFYPDMKILLDGEIVTVLNKKVNSNYGIIQWEKQKKMIMKTGVAFLAHSLILAVLF